MKRKEFAFMLAVSFLLAGCLPFLSSGGQNWALARAASVGDSRLVDRALSSGADVNSRPTAAMPNSHGSPTILMVAAYGGYQTSLTEDQRLAVIKELLGQGADPWLRDNLGRTAVDYARLSGSRRIAAYLLNYRPGTGMLKMPAAKVR